MLHWVNESLEGDYKKVEELCSGTVSNPIYLPIDGHLATSIMSKCLISLLIWR